MKSVIRKKSVMYILRWSHLGKPERVHNFMKQTGWLSNVMKDSMNTYCLNGILNHCEGA